jgi:DNA repair exonuclease SbcCD ATPase subunit
MAEQFHQSLIATVNNTGDSDASEQIEQKIEELRDEKNQRIRELEKEGEQYEQRVAALQAQVEELEQYREYKDKFEDWEEKRDVVREALFRLRDELDIEVDGDVAKYKQRIKQQEDRITELEQTLRRRTGSTGQNPQHPTENNERGRHTVRDHSRPRREDVHRVASALQHRHPVHPADAAPLVLDQVRGK